MHAPPFLSCVTVFLALFLAAICCVVLVSLSSTWIWLYLLCLGVVVPPSLALSLEVLVDSKFLFWFTD